MADLYAYPINATGLTVHGIIAFQSSFIYVDIYILNVFVRFECR